MLILKSKEEKEKQPKELKLRWALSKETFAASLHGVTLLPESSVVIYRLEKPRLHRPLHRVSPVDGQQQQEMAG